jgi:putative intracellular protease/amidase
MTMGLLAFHGLTQLDLTGPYEVLCRAPQATVVIISAHPGELMVSGWPRVV